MPNAIWSCMYFVSLCVIRLTASISPPHDTNETLKNRHKYCDSKTFDGVNWFEMKFMICSECPVGYTIKFTIFLECGPLLQKPTHVQPWFSV